MRNPKLHMTSGSAEERSSFARITRRAARSPQLVLVGIPNSADKCLSSLDWKLDGC